MLAANARSDGWHPTCYILFCNLNFIRGLNTMRAALPIVGVILILLGLIWVGQGVGLIPGSFMTGQLFWAFAGAVCILIGTSALYFTFRRPKVKAE